VLNTETASSTAPAPGPFGRFYLQELINSGGMADIWVAMDSDGKHHALRRMLPQYRLNLLAKHRFLRGCRILARIPRHDQIIGYIEHGKIKGQPYLLMEYVVASNLKELHARSDAVIAENAPQILIDIAAGLEHLHEYGYMHLDFKPENVLVTRNAGVRIIDFDLARPIPEKPVKLRKNPGTPAYMAPEQLQHQPIGHTVDIFAFGVTAYELLTQSKPFPGETPDEILARQLDRANFVTPRAHNPSIPETMEKVILRCLEQDPAKRYPYMGMMARELRDALYL
jgi:serine/threonine protein kinase